jgi:hypothetical protein
MDRAVNHNCARMAPEAPTTLLDQGESLTNLSLRSSYVWPHLRRQLNLKTKVPLVIVLRTGDLARSHLFQNFIRTTERLVNHPALVNCEFTHPADAIGKWQAT